MILSQAAEAAAWPSLLYQRYAEQGTGCVYGMIACSCLQPASLPARIMRIHRLPVARAVTLALAFLTVICASLVLADCSAPGQAHPPRSRHALPASAARPSSDATAQVISTYTGYFPALEAAEPQPHEEAALARYAAQPYLGHVLTQIAAYRSLGEIAWGYLVPHVTSVQISGNEAVVRDCQDASNAWLVSAATGRVIPGTVGSARTFLVAALTRGGDGRWRLTLLAHVAGSCSRVPSPR
jgi:hypothetical protein